MTDRTPKFTRDQPEARRKQLIEATARCLARFGLEGTTVRSVAKEAGVSPGLVRHHFAGMRDLVTETYRWTIKEIGAGLDEAVARAPQTPEGRMRGFIDASFSGPLLNPDLLGVWLTYWSLVRTDPEVHAIHAEVYAAYRKNLEDMLKAIAAERKLEFDTRLASLAFTALLDGLWLEYCLDSRTFTAAEATTTVHDWLDSLIAGHFKAQRGKPVAA